MCSCRKTELRARIAPIQGGYKVRWVYVCLSCGAERKKDTVHGSKVKVS
jgi:hypothetical protein